MIWIGNFVMLGKRVCYSTVRYWDPGTPALQGRHMLRLYFYFTEHEYEIKATVTRLEFGASCRVRLVVARTVRPVPATVRTTRHTACTRTSIH